MPDDPRLPIAANDRSPRALTAALHRLAGGMHTASVALHLLASSASGDGVKSAAVAQAGLRGIESAARAKLLVGATLGPVAAQPDELAHLYDDVVDILGLQARRCAVRLTVDAGLATRVTSPQSLVRLLERGLAKLEASQPERSLHLSEDDVEDAA